MFRTILVHQQEQIYKLYIAFGIRRYMPIYLAYVVGSKSFPPDIQKPRQMENAVRDI